MCVCVCPRVPRTHLPLGACAVGQVRARLYACVCARGPSCVHVLVCLCACAGEVVRACMCVRARRACVAANLCPQWDNSTKFLCTGDVYRRDEIDSSHYPAFHQMEVSPPSPAHTRALPLLSPLVFLSPNLLSCMQSSLSRSFLSDGGGRFYCRWGFAGREVRKKTRGGEREGGRGEM